MCKITFLRILVATLISYNMIQASPIIKGPVDLYPKTLPEKTFHLECLINLTAEISSVTWQKTANSTELLYIYDGSEGSIIPEPPSNSTWKYRVLESDEREGNFTIEIADISLTDVGVYECQVESDGENYTEQALVTIYGNAWITQVPEEVQNNQVYDVQCLFEISVASDDTHYLRDIDPYITIKNTPSDKRIYESYERIIGGFQGAFTPAVFFKYITTRANYEDQKESSCMITTRIGYGEYDLTREVNILRNPVITKGPKNRYPRARESSTVLLECEVNKTADISLVTWSKTFVGSTELIYMYDGSEGNIVPPPPSDSTWKYRVLESDEQESHFTLEIRNISLLDVGTYECTVESNGRNYTEQGNVTVYGSAKVIQSPELAVHGESRYNYFCSLEIAMVGNSTEDVMLATPNISLWYTNGSPDPEVAITIDSNWTGLGTIRKNIPLYHKYGRTSRYIRYDRPPNSFWCSISTLENPVFNTKITDTAIGVPVITVRFAPTRTHFKSGDSVICSGHGSLGVPSTMTSYQWFDSKQPSVPKINGNRLTWNDSDIGESEWRCEAANNINDVPYSNSLTGTFTVESKGDTLLGSKLISLLLAFSSLFMYMNDLL